MWPKLFSTSWWFENHKKWGNTAYSPSRAPVLFGVYKLPVLKTINELFYTLLLKCVTQSDYIIN